MIKDVHKLYVFNESDLQARVYLHLQGVLNKMNKFRLVLNKPSFPVQKGKRLIYPDLVVVNERGVPEAAIELKFLLKGLPDPQKDIAKLRNFRAAHRSIQKGYFIWVYDDEDRWYDIRDESWMKHYFFSIGINVRRQPDGRQRHGYDDWRQTWDEFRIA